MSKIFSFANLEVDLPKLNSDEINIIKQTESDPWGNFVSGSPKNAVISPVKRPSNTITTDQIFNQQTTEPLQKANSKAIESNIPESELPSNIQALLTKIHKTEEELQKKNKELDAEKVRLTNLRDELLREREGFEKEREEFEKTKTLINICNIRNEEIVKLNIGGKEFLTSKATLCSVKDSFFEKIFNSDQELTYQSDGSYFIDHDPTNVHLVLAVLRGEEPHLPKIEDPSYDGIFQDFNFFGVPMKVEKLRGQSKVKNSLSGHTAGVWCVLLLKQQNQIATGSLDKTIRIWDIDKNECIKVYSKHTLGVWCLIQPSLNFLISGSQDSTIKYWNLEMDDCIRTLDKHKDAVTGMEIVSDGKYLISSSFDKTIIIWDLKAGLELKRLTLHKDSITCFIIYKNKLVSADLGGQINIFHLNGSSNYQLGKHDQSVRCIGIYQCIIATGGGDNKVKVWNLKTSSCMTTLNGHKGMIRAVKIYGTTVVSASQDKSIRVWDYVTSTCKQELNGHNDIVLSLALFGNTTIISGAQDKTIKFWRCIYLEHATTSYIEKSRTATTSNSEENLSDQPIVINFDQLQGIE